MKIKVIFLSIAGMLVASACSRDMSTDPGKVIVRDLNQSEQQISNAGEQFGISLFKHMVENEESNIFISPLSVSMALGMTLNGAAGSTESAMRQTLDFSGMEQLEINKAYSSLIKLLTSIDPKVQFEIANSIWTDEKFGVEPSFADVNQTYFDALIKAIDFRDASASDQINNWVDDKTHGKIDKVIDSIDARTVMYLINAIYFNGTWTYEFDKGETKEQRFKVNDNLSVQTPFMRQSNDNFSYFDNELMQAIDLPYGNGQFRMTVLLPRYGKTVADILQSLSPQNWKSWMSAFVEQKGTLALPKFKLEYKNSLVDVLKTLGMDPAFSDEADFTGINKNGGLFISDVLHKTYVDVDEEGTEAAAVTVVEMRVTSVGGETGGFSMSVDRPFLFAIREKSSGVILFIGKMNNPSEN
jgi:serine protease inhibitor